MFRSMNRILRWTKGYHRRLYLGSLCSFLATWAAAGPVMLAVWALGLVIESAQEGTALDAKLPWLCLGGIILLIVLRFVCAYWKNRLQESIGTERAAQQRLELGNLLKRVSLGYFSKNNLGDILAALTTELSTLELQSMKMVYENLYNAWLHPDDLEARDNMLLASNIAMGGMADVGVQIGHGIGQALGAYTHAAHGVTCAWALPYVVEHLCDTEAPKIREIAKAFGLQLPEGASNVEVKDAVVGAIKDLSAAVELPMPRDLGFTMEKDYENFVKFVMREQRLLQMSARPVTEENVRAYMTDLLHR